MRNVSTASLYEKPRTLNAPRPANNVQRLVAGIDSTGTVAYLNEGESSSWLQRIVFMLHLIGHVFLYPFVLIDLPLCHHVKQGARGDGDGDSVTGFGL